MIRPPLDSGFLPAALWNRAYRERARSAAGARELVFGLTRPDGMAFVHRETILPDEPGNRADNWKFAERLLKFLLWSCGANRVLAAGAPEIAARLEKEYAATGRRGFDHRFFGGTCFGGGFAVEARGADAIPPAQGHARPVGRNLDGCRIGFDLGGSDRKCAALIDGKVVHSEEVPWDPYFQSDASYHIDGIRDSLRRAAAHLPRVDAIGGSAAGIYIDNEPRVGSLFRGLPKEVFDERIRPLFRELQREWGGVPFEVANDGDVTALAGSMALGDEAVLGVSMGTSEAAGYIDGEGRITGRINELAFAPVDYRDDAPEDEWSGDRGCGVQYFSQQAVGRLLPASGIEVSEDASLPERLETLQERMRQGDERAGQVYRTIGVYFGYSIAHYSEFYDFRNLLVLGRVTSGAGGEILLDSARRVLEAEFAELSTRIRFHQPDEQTKRHGQAVAAASLPALSGRK